ncbi:hypothetical protein BDB00DRAFT_879150 [Zychaea mexicana]|uniref:uncharacterized protein n=1 Tax=Zychaea mexicana TaxID=64656 RepID=UPI0022FE6126|nr:uncharacterized protein BDB00DRAFT_879150 [Zychaea mexicana]KAI9482513.1 hypothetical protein BDB00DRAFT_879150 [Zychaea mexicana]
MPFLKTPEEITSTSTTDRMSQDRQHENGQLNIHTLPAREEEFVKDEYEDEDEDDFENECGPLRKRVDFLARLPYEVVDMIISELSINELLVCLDVSPKWQELLVEKRQHIWREVTLDHENYQSVSQLNLIGKHIRKYCLYFACQEILDGTVDQILSGSMNKLESLAWDCSDFSGRDVIKCVTLLQGSLTNLELVTTQDTRYLLPFDCPSLPSILNACPTLERIKVSLHSSEIQSNHLKIPRGSKLKYLHWNSGESMTLQEAEDILDACPSLVYLNIGCLDGPVPLSAFRTKCPTSLSYLHVDTGKSSSYGWSCGTDSNLSVNGLQSLSTCCINNEDWEELQTVTLMDQSTLQDMTVCHNDSFDLGGLLNIFKGPQVSLRYTHIYWRQRAVIIATTKNISPGENDETSPSGVITSAFERCHKDRHIPWFINSLESNAHARKVSKLSFYNCGTIDWHIPQLLQLPSLQELYFDGYGKEIGAVAGIIDKLCSPSSTPRLRHLYLGPVQGLTDKVVPRFAHIRGLKHLTLSGCSEITDEGIYSLANIDSDLEELSLLNCLNVTPQAIKYINQQLERRKQQMYM